MYIDLIILIILIILFIIFFKRFSSFVFLLAIVDLFLRILAFIKHNIGLDDIAQVAFLFYISRIFINKKKI